MLVKIIDCNIINKICTLKEKNCLNNKANGKRIQINNDLITTIIGGLSDSPELLAQINFKVLYFHCHQLIPFFLPKCNTNYAKNQHLYRTMNIDNKDPPAPLYY